MQRIGWCAAWACLLWSAATGAEEAFSKAVRAEDFSAAGLAKLSPQELARLDALVRDYKSGALEASRRAAAAAEAARAQAEERAAKAEALARAVEPAKKNAAGGLLNRAKVILTPGTEIEYETVESRLVGTFLGWEGRKTVFALENGQRWQVAENNAVYAGARIENPPVKIVPGALGSFWLVVEGVRPRVKVVLLSPGR